MGNNFTLLNLRNSLRRLILLVAVLMINGWAFSQSFTISSTSFANNNGSGQVTFNLQNTNSYPIKITKIEGVVGVAGSNTCDLWYKTTAISSSPGAISNANGWYLGATGSFTGIANSSTSSTQTFLSGISFIIPANTTYGINVYALNQRYSTISAGTTTFSAGGVNFITGTNIGWGVGTPPSAPTNTPRGWIGKITFEPVLRASNNAAITDLVSPVNFCAGNRDIKVTLKNNGKNRIDSVKVNWKLDGVMQNVINWKYPLDTVGGTSYPNDTTITLANISFSSGNGKVLKVWSSYPNGVVDTVPEDDTLDALLKPSLSGAYTIGGTNPDYATLSDAASDLGTYGVCGPVTFTVRPGTYNEKVTLSNISGTSSTNTIIFDGVDSATRKITWNETSASAFPGVVNLSNASFITFKNFGIIATGSSTCVGITVQSGANNNSFYYCNVKVSETITSSTCFGIGVCGSTYTTTSTGANNLFQSCTVTGGYAGVVMYGTSSAVFTVGNRIKDCILLNAYQYGMYIYYQDHDTITGNQLTMRTSSTSAYGIYCYYNQNNRVDMNILSNIAYLGMYIYQNNNNGSVGRMSVSNNIVNMNGSQPYSSQYGLEILYCGNVDVVHNTLYMANASSSSYGLYISYGTGQVVKNNIAHTLCTTASSYIIYVPSVTGFTAFDHNLLYDASATSFSYWGGTYYTDLSALKAAANPYHQNSRIKIANFVSLVPQYEDLHLTQNTAPEYGDPAYSKPVDVDGDPRCNFAATIGADESTYGQGSITVGFTVPDTIFIGSPTTLFNNAPAGGPMVHKWYVNASLASTNLNLLYTFNSATTYLVKLVTTGCFGTDSMSKVVRVYNPTVKPVANFISDVNLAETYQPVYFTDLSTKGPTWWYWTVTPATGVNFSNGTSNNSQHPVINFANPGLYSICLRDSNSIGTSTTTCKTNYILVKATTQMCIFPFESRISSGTIYDDGGPNASYGANHTAASPCNFLIDPCASSVNLQFSDFNLAAGAYLRVYDGRDKFGIPLHTGLGFTGNNIPGGSSGLTATSGKMYIEFQSASALAPGFKASWTSVAGSYSAPQGYIDAPDTVYDCGGLFTMNFASTNPAFLNNEAYYKWYFDYANSSAFPDGEGTGFKSIQWAYSSVGPKVIRLDIEGCGGTLILYDTIVVATTPGKPVVQFASNYTTGTTTDVLTLSDKSKYGPTWWDWKITGPGAVTTVSGGPSTSSWAVKLSAIGQYTVQLTDSNCIGKDSLTKTNYINIINYCSPTVSTLNPDFAISRVLMGRIDTLINGGITGFDYTNNTPAIGATTYRNNMDQLKSYYIGNSSFTKVVEEVVSLGATVNFKVYRQTNYNPFNVNIWVDYNQDGNFASNELVASSGSLAGTVYSGSFTVPNTATLGYSRIRIGTAFANLSNTPCGANQYGEFNDYRIKITPDDVAPVISFTGNDSVEVEVGRNFTDPGFAVTDNVTNPTPYTVTGITSGTQITQYPFSTYYTVTATDASGNITNRTRTVVAGPDITEPVITLNGSPTVYVEVKSAYNDSGATATDFYFGNFTPNITSVSTVDVNTLGTYSVIYNVTDSSGNAANPVVRTVIVRDSQKPVINITGGNTIYVNVFSPFTPPNAVVTDNYNSGLSYTITGSSVNTNVLGTYQLFYNAEDNSGNMAITQVLSVIVRDITAPGLILFQSDTTIVDVGTLTKVPEPGYSTTDNYYPNGALTLVVDYSVVNLNQLGIYKVRYYLSDPSGNIDSSMVRVYKVVDRTAPVLTLNGKSYMSWPRWKPFVDPGVTVTDNYYTNITPDIDNSLLDIYSDGVYEIHYSATDPSGNKSDELIRLVEIYTPANGIQASAQTTGINVYPNPGNGKVNISLELPENSDGMLTIYDSNGRQVYVNNSIGSMKLLQLDLSDQPDGIYYVQVNGKDFSASKAFSIQK
jgi:PKD repeat protein